MHACMQLETFWRRFMEAHIKLQLLSASMTKTLKDDLVIIGDSMETIITQETSLDISGI
jgi:hypothetical protein